MTIEEAIKHAREVAKEQRENIIIPKSYYSNFIEKTNRKCLLCADEHEQLAKWLEELIVLRKAYELACSELDKHANNPNCELEPISNRGKEAIQEFFIDKAKEELENDKQ